MNSTQGGGGCLRQDNTLERRSKKHLARYFNLYTDFFRAFSKINAFSFFCPYNGFTLAEVLITLGIIGIVASMTLPTVINKTQEKQFKVAFKKQYSTFAQAMQRVYIEDGSAYEQVDWKQMPTYFCKLQQSQKVIKSGIKCDEVLKNGFTDNSDWPRTGQYYWHKDGKWFDKKGQPQHINTGYSSLSYVLPDGAIVNYNCSNQIFIDVNGYQKPNTIGKDIFFMTVQTKNMVPSIISITGSQVIPNACTMGGTNSTPTLTINNYEDDCKNGTGWGCSLLYLTD